MFEGIFATTAVNGPRSKVVESSVFLRRKIRHHRCPPLPTFTMSSKEDKKAEKARLAAEKKAAKDTAKADKKVWTRRPCPCKTKVDLKSSSILPLPSRLGQG